MSFHMFTPVNKVVNPPPTVVGMEVIFTIFCAVAVIFAAFRGRVMAGLLDFASWRSTSLRLAFCPLIVYFLPVTSILIFPLDSEVLVVPVGDDLFMDPVEAARGLFAIVDDVL